MAGAGRPKTQQKSIMSFFAVGAKPAPTPAPVAAAAAAAPAKRKTAAGASDETSEAAESPKKRKLTASPKQAASTKTVKDSKRAERAKEVEEVKDSDDVDMDVAEPQAEEGVENEVNGKVEEEEEEEEIKPTKRVTRAKPGRRRLRQRIVEDDEFSDDELPLPRKEKDVVEIDDDDEVEEEEDGTDLKTAEDSHVTRNGVDKSQKDVEKKQKAIDDEDEDSAFEVDGHDDDDEEEADDDEDEVEEIEEENLDANDVVKEEKKKASTKPQSSVKKATKTNKSSSSTAPKGPSAAATAAGKANMDASIIPLDVDAECVPYTSLATLLNKIEVTSSRLVIQELLMNFFRDVIQKAPQDLLACIYLCVCTDLAPPFENLKIGIGDAILMKAIGEATGTNLKFVKDMYHKEGDLGKVAQNARSKQHTLSFAAVKPAATKPTLLSVPDVYKQFVKIAKMTGNNSQQQKCSMIKSLLVKCEKDKKAAAETNGSSGNGAAEAAKYIIRGLQGKLRIGLAEKSILIALTYAFMNEKDAKDKEKQEKALAQVKRAFAECPSYNALVSAFEEVQAEVGEGARSFLSVDDFTEVAKRCVLTPGTPVSPMLARPTKAYAMVFDRFQGMPFSCEYKYDGERAQIHILPNGEIAIFSRNFENSTERFPDVKLMITKAAKESGITSCIVDAEVVAVDRATNKRLPFQVLSTRSRKNVKVEDIKVPVCIYAFDLLFLNGESLLQEPLGKRRELLKERFEVEDGFFEFASSMDVDGVAPGSDDAEAMEIAVDKVRNFLEEAVKENCEGLMVKTLEKDATYEPANRSHKWLKLKKDYLDGIGDSTDLVPIGAFHGRGKRTGVYGAYLLACYDPDTEMFQAITKLGTGLSDERLKEFSAQLKEKVVERPPSEYSLADSIKPDVWFEPSCVWEILGADLSISPKYTAAMGLVAKDKGVSLRFPRFIRTREDKTTIQATTAEQIADLYRAQGLATVGGDEEDEDDMLI